LTLGNRIRKRMGLPPLVLSLLAILPVLPLFEQSRTGWVLDKHDSVYVLYTIGLKADPGSL